MPTLGGGIAHWNNIDDSLWEHGRVQIADTPLTSHAHDSGVIIDYIYCPTPKDVKPKGTILLIHGFPQTSYQFRRVITPIAKRGYNVVVPNYRGAGGSSKPSNGYTKKEMATDLYWLLRKLDMTSKVHVVGHDIGGMIAHAFAMQYPESTASIVWGECPLPGTSTYDKLKHSSYTWHFSLHCVPDLPEALIQGNEKMYLKHFYDRYAQNPDAISAYDLDVYTNAYSQPGAMRAGLNVYRAFEQDAVENTAFLYEVGKSSVPCLTLWGKASFADESTAAEMASQFYKNHKYEAIAGSGHWVAEEKPGGFVDALVGWLDEQVMA